MSIKWGGRGSGHFSRWSESALDSSVSPSLLLQFVDSQTLDSRITFTRSTTATYYNSAGVLSTAAINAPRFEYNATTLASLGLLIEGQRTNALLYSSQFDNAYWVKSNSGTGTIPVVSANYGVSPDGTQNAARIQLDSGAAGASQIVSGNLSVVAGTSYTFSVWMKSLTTNVTVTMFNISNVQNVTVTTSWQRFTYTVSSASTTPTAGVRLTKRDAFGSSGSADILVYGAQFETGAFVTSYIPTVASQVTRTADVAVMTGTNFSSWYNDSAGTFAATYEASPNTFTSYLVASNGVTAQNSCHFDNDGGNMRVVYYSGSSAVATLSLGAVGTVGTVNKVASAYAVNDFAASRNAGAVVTDTAGAVPVSVTQLNIGADPSGAATNVMNSHIRQITYYPGRLSNAQLQGLTA